ncbi:hypothetical protein EB001_18670 [bacterium]|nr:hypothetical protein [bacterium]
MNILGKEYSGVLHIHIPKTAGSSIIKILQDNNLDNWKRGYPRHHDPYFYMQKENNIDDKVFSFAVVRNPYTRTYSSYHQYNKANKTNISFMEYLNNILEKRISKISPLLHLPMAWYVTDSQNNIQVTKIYKFENIKELEEDLSWELGFHHIGNYTKDMYIEEYTDVAIDIVRKFYALDFSIFGYSTDFAKTLE